MSHCKGDDAEMNDDGEIQDNDSMSTGCDKSNGSPHTGVTQFRTD